MKRVAALSLQIAERMQQSDREEFDPVLPTTSEHRHGATLPACCSEGNRKCCGQIEPREYALGKLIWERKPFGTADAQTLFSVNHDSPAHHVPASERAGCDP